MQATTPRRPRLEIERLTKIFPVVRGALRQRIVGHARAVDDVSLESQPGETFGLVGESGCGKTTIAKLVLRVLTPTSGRILVDGQDIRPLAGASLRQHRHRVQVVLQDPYSSLDPRMRVFDTIREPLHGIAKYASRTTTAERVRSLLDVVGLPAASVNLFPHQFSGGQRQRIAIARALAPEPELLVLDEPTSALDVSIRAQVLNLLRDLQARMSLTYLLISHDLDSVAYLAHRVGVMYLGKLMETGPVERVYTRPLHPYTRTLLASSGHLTGDDSASWIARGEVASSTRIPSGCRFHPRCPVAFAPCAMVEPALRAHDGRLVACHLYDEEGSTA